MSRKIFKLKQDIVSKPVVSGIDANLNQDIIDIKNVNNRQDNDIVNLNQTVGEFDQRLTQINGDNVLQSAKIAALTSDIKDLQQADMVNVKTANTYQIIEGKKVFTNAVKQNAYPAEDDDLINIKWFRDNLPANQGGVNPKLVVMIKEDQLIEGKKSFKNPVVIPDAVDLDDAVNKRQLDNTKTLLDNKIDPIKAKLDQTVDELSKQSFLIFRGTYSAGVTYIKGDAIIKNSKLYLCIVELTLNDPETNSTDWKQLDYTLDTSNFVTTNTDQEVRGVKTFTHQLKLGNHVILEKDSAQFLEFKRNNSRTGVMGMGSSSSLDLSVLATQGNLILDGREILASNKQIKRVADPNHDTDAVNKRSMDRAINTALTNIPQAVDLISNQTVDGQKLFSNIKSNQTPSDPTDLVNKLYADEIKTKAEQAFIKAGNNESAITNNVSEINRLKQKDIDLQQSIDTQVAALNLLTDRLRNSLVEHWRGEWNNTSTYQPGANIYYQGAVYVILEATAAGENPINTPNKFFKKSAEVNLDDYARKDQDNNFSTNQTFTSVTSNKLYVSDPGNKIGQETGSANAPQLTIFANDTYNPTLRIQSNHEQQQPSIGFNHKTTEMMYIGGTSRSRPTEMIILKRKGKLFVQADEGFEISSNTILKNGKFISAATLPTANEHLTNKQYVDSTVTNATSSAALKPAANTFTNTNTFNSVLELNKSNVEQSHTVDFKRNNVKYGSVGRLADTDKSMGIEALEGQVQLKSRDGVNVFSKKIINLASPTENSDAANKQYVDSKFKTIAWSQDINNWTPCNTQNHKMNFSTMDTNRVHVFTGSIPNEFQSSSSQIELLMKIEDNVTGQPDLNPNETIYLVFQSLGKSLDDMKWAFLGKNWSNANTGGAGVPIGIAMSRNVNQIRMTICKIPGFTLPNKQYNISFYVRRIQ